ncbi:MAG: hypothetical protein JO301_03015 [Chitinophagaceae bacterium]|nr:hypothetical protein [Chitinophagaceae bacterium]
MAVFLAIVVAFMGCQKEFSVENGAFGGVAQGELVDSLGYCKNITVSGTYKVDTPMTASNYVTVNVNFTSAGKYKIYTDTVNGMWFLDSGFVVSAGQQSVKLKGKGTPILAKQSDFAVFFGNNLCAFSIIPSGSGGSSGGGGTTGNTDYFPTTAGSSWVYQYSPKLGTVDTFTVRVANTTVQVTGDPLVYSQFGTQMKDTFYFAKSSSGDFYALSTVDFDYTLVFDSIPNYFISYPFLKPNANVGDTWETAEYGKVKVVGVNSSEVGMAKAVFTIITKNTVPYTIGGKTYDNVINVKRDIMFKPDNGTYRVLLSGNSYYAKGYGLIDQVLGTSPNTQAVSLYKTPTIK